MGNSPSQAARQDSFVTAASFSQSSSSAELQRTSGSRMARSPSRTFSYELSSSVSKSRIEQKTFEALLSERFSAVACLTEPSLLRENSTWPVLLAIARWLGFELSLASDMANPAQPEYDLAIITRQTSSLSAYEPVDVPELLQHPDYVQWWKTAATSLGLQGKPPKEVYQRIVEVLSCTPEESQDKPSSSSSGPDFTDVAPFVIPFLPPKQLAVFSLVNKSLHAEVKSSLTSIRVTKLTAQLPISFPNLKRVEYCAEEPLDTKHFAILSRLPGLNTLHAMHAEILDFLSLRQLSALTELRVELPFFDVFANEDAVVHEIFFQGIFWALPELKVLHISMSQGSFNEHTFEHMASFIRADIVVHLLIHRHLHCSASHLNQQPVGQHLNTSALAAQLQLLSSNVRSIVCDDTVEHDPILGFMVTAALSLFEGLETFQIPSRLLQSLLRKGDLNAATITALLCNHVYLTQLGLGNPRLPSGNFCMSAILPSMTHLMRLHLGSWLYRSNEEANEVWRCLSGCTNLEHLTLDEVSMDINDVEEGIEYAITQTELLAALSFLPKLRHLHLTRVVVDKGLAQVSSLCRLESLVLEDTFFATVRLLTAADSCVEGVSLCGDNVCGTPVSEAFPGEGVRDESATLTFSSCRTSMPAEVSFSSAVSALPSFRSAENAYMADAVHDVLLSIGQLQWLTCLEFRLSDARATDVMGCVSKDLMDGWLWSLQAPQYFRDCLSSLSMLTKLDVSVVDVGHPRQSFLQDEFVGSLVPYLVRVPDLSIRMWSSV